MQLYLHWLLTVLFLYIFLIRVYIYTVYRKQNFYFVTQGSKDHIENKETPLFSVFIHQLIPPSLSTDEF